MSKTTKHSERTRELLIKHYQTYPKMEPEDIFKYIYQSSFGCEHLASSESMVLDYIEREYKATFQKEPPLIEPLDGKYSRVFLSCLNNGLKPETLAKLFCLSAKKEPDGNALLEKKIKVVKALVADKTFPFNSKCFNKILDEWRDMGYPAMHHSDNYRLEYRPAYRVISNRYTDFLRLFTEIDKISDKGSLIIAIEGGSASGKTTLADILQQVYDVNVFHMDDFFLRPEQRTPQRLAELGGNIDKERFSEEVLQALKQNKAVHYRRFDCQTQTLGYPITIEPKKFTVIEGVYSTHPALSRYYDLSVFLEIESEYQKKRIRARNSPRHANRFFNEWIPLENRYFSGTNIKERIDLILPIYEK